MVTGQEQAEQDQKMRDKPLFYDAKAWREPVAKEKERCETRPPSLSLLRRMRSSEIKPDMEVEQSVKRLGSAW